MRLWKELMMRLIINADDLGINKEVNDAIFGFMLREIVTSATIIANAPQALEALEISRKFSGCSFGVHLNLTEFKPLTDNPDLAPLLTADGEFSGKSERDVQMTSALREAIFDEWSAQIDCVTSYNQVVSHIDSHHHVHTIPRLFSVLKRVQRKFGIRKVRLSKNIYGPMHPCHAGLLVRKQLWNFALRHYFRTNTTLGFTSFQEFYDLVQKDLISTGLSLVKHATEVIELMVHPGNPGFRQENCLLSSGWIERREFKRISYNEI